MCSCLWSIWWRSIKPGPRGSHGPWRGWGGGALVGQAGGPGQESPGEAILCTSQPLRGRVPARGTPRGSTQDRTECPTPRVSTLQGSVGPKVL